MFGLGHSSVERYIHALAVCNSLAELASRGSEAEFYDRLGTLMCLMKYWTRGHGDAKVVFDSDEVEDESVDKTQLAVEIQNISFESILSDDRLTEFQPVLVLCSKNDGRTCNGTASENVHLQMERYNVFPCLLNVPSARSSKCRAVRLLSA